MLTNFPNGIFATPNVGGGLDAFSGNKIFFVDGDNGNDGNQGTSPDQAFATIQAAVTFAAAQDGAIVYIKARDMAAGATDPVSYAEAVTIPATCSRMVLIGVSGNRTQQGLPQIKPAGAAHTFCLTINAPGCLIMNLGFNGNSTAGAPINSGIRLNSNGATGTINAAGTTITNCHFKNCAGTTVTSAATGGAIEWTAQGEHAGATIIL